MSVTGRTGIAAVKLASERRRAACVVRPGNGLIYELRGSSRRPRELASRDAASPCAAEVATLRVRREQTSRREGSLSGWGARLGEEEHGGDSSCVAERS